MATTIPGDERQRREQQILDRIKELDLAHRNRLSPTGLAHALSLRYLRRIAARWVTPPRKVPRYAVPAPEPGAVEVVHVGHGTVHVVTPHARVLVDPLLTSFFRGIRRAVASPLADEDRGATTCVLITHGHADHLHMPSLRLLPKSALVIVPPGLEGKLARLGFPQVVALAPEDLCQHGDLTIAAVAARHEGAGGKGGGAANGYVLQAPEVAVYVAGDTGYFSGFTDIGRRFRPDVAVLPIGGYAPYPLRANHLSPLDAVYAFEDLRARVLVPVAHGVLPRSYEPLDEPLRWLRAACDARGLAERLAAVLPGERVTIRRASPAGLTP